MGALLKFTTEVSSSLYRKSFRGEGTPKAVVSEGWPWGAREPLPALRLGGLVWQMQHWASGGLAPPWELCFLSPEYCKPQSSVIFVPSSLKGFSATLMTLLELPVHTATGHSAHFSEMNWLLVSGHLRGRGRAVLCLFPRPWS